MARHVSHRQAIARHGFDEKRTVPPWWTVVGVVADVRYRDLRAPSLDVYVPYDQAEFSIGDIVVRTRGSAQAAWRRFTRACAR